MNTSMLVRTENGAWERLEPQHSVPDGGIAQLFGTDIGPVLGYSTPLVVAAVQPELSSGKPDALCIDADGNVFVVVLTFEKEAATTLPTLLSHAGALHGMDFESFSNHCNIAHANGVTEGGLAAFVHEHNLHADFHRGTFEVTVADALAQGRFSLIAMVVSAPQTLLQSMRYLNASGADASCFEIASFCSNSVFAVQATPLDVGQQRRVVEMKMTAAGLVAVTERLQNEATAKLMTQLQMFCTSNFSSVEYDGDNAAAWMRANIKLKDDEAVLITAGSDGTVSIHFESLAPVDRNWQIRSNLVEGLNRLLGADLGEVKKISKLNLTMGEHLMDATLMELLCEILGDTIAATKGKVAAAA